MIWKTIQLVVILCLVNISAVSFAQLNITSTMTAEITVNGNSGEYEISVTNNSGSIINNVVIDVDVPTGIMYTNSSINNVSGHGITELNVANLTFNLPSLGNNSSAVFRINLYALCASIDFQEGGGIFRNDVTVSYATFNYSHTSASYNILYAALSFLEVTPKNTTVISGTSTTRLIRIINGGNGSINNFKVTHSYNSELVISATSKGSISGNDILFSASDFTDLGNNNSWFDQDEIIEITVTYTGTSCTDKTINTSVVAGWNGESGFCQNANTNINTTIDFNEPTLTLSTNGFLAACYSSATAHQQSIVIKNTGSGLGSSVQLEILKSSDGSTYDENILSRFDISTIQYKYNNGNLTSLSASSPTYSPYSGDLTCLGNNAVGKFFLNLPSISPNDSITVYWDMYSCCPTTCGAHKVAGWISNITYNDVCAGTSYNASSEGLTDFEANMSIFNETHPQIINGETDLYNYYISDYTNTYNTTNNSRLIVSFTLPAGIKINSSSDLEWVSSPNTWVPKYFNYNQTTGQIIAHYQVPEPFTVSKSEIKINLTADCGMTGASAGSKNIELNVHFDQDTSCVTNCSIPIICSNTITTALICPSGLCDDGGMRNTSYTLVRSSFGLPDNDENGLPDPTGNLDFDKININRAMFGDTLKASTNGLVHAGTGISQWPNGYYEVIIEEGINTSPLYATIRVYDASTSQIKTKTISSITRNDVSSTTTYSVDISPASLAGVFSGYQYEANDSVRVDLFVKVTTNIGGQKQEINSTGRMYLSTTPSPSPANQYYCNNYGSNITLIGYYFTVSTNENFTVTGCTQTIKQDFFLSIGACCNNFGGGNLFPYEYRNWAEVATAKVVIPTYYTITNIDLKQFRTKGTNATYTETISNITNDYRNYDTLIFDLSQYYTTEGGSMNPSDDGFSGRILIDVSPSCDIPINTFQDVYWAFNFNNSPYLGNGTTSWYTHTTNDRIRYNPSKIILSSTNANLDGINKTVNWNLSIKNPLGNESIATPWIYIKSPTGSVDVLTLTESTSGDTLQLTNDLYLTSSLSNNEKRNFNIEAQYSACTPENLIVYSGYACNTTPTTYAAVDCPHNNQTLKVTPKPSQLQVQIDAQTVGDNCSPLVNVELLMSSVRVGAVDSLNMIVTTPTNNSILNSTGTNTYAYPNTASSTSFSDPTLNNHQYIVPVSTLNAYVNANGLPGITDVGNNKIKVNMQFEMQNNFIPGDFLLFTFESKNNCNQDLPTLNLAYDPNISFEETEITGLTTEQGDNWSVSWGDFNNDGLDDVFITDYNENIPNALYKNNGNLSFTKITSGSIATDLASSLSATWGDYNNDGYLDLFVANNIGHPNFLYQNNGDETFTRINNGHMTTYDGYSHSATWGDYNNDGLIDLFVCDYMPTRYNLLYKNTGNGSFALQTMPDLINSKGHSIGASWSDFDNDGDLDLYVPNAGEPNFFYKNENGVLKLQSNSIVKGDSAHSTGCSWGDVDNDGDMDLFVANASKSNNKLYINNGAGDFTESTSIIKNAANDTHGSTWADFDNDGDIDLFVTNDKLSANEFYTNNGDGSFSILETDLTKELENSFGTAVSDIDNDGDLDLFIANHTGEENVLFLNTKGACENSFCATLVGQGSNKSAIGAKVFVYTTIYGTPTLQLREISSQTGGGAGGQNSMRVHIGIGDATTIDSIRIEWPSGNIQKIFNHTVSDCFTIYESGGSLVNGIAYLDNNSNCTKDGNEMVLANQEIVINPSGKKIYTNSTGYYQVYLPDGAYTISANSKDNFTSSCSSIPLTITGNGTNSYLNNNFGFTATCSNPDLNINMGIAALRRGFADNLYINILNKGGETANNVTFKLLLPNGVNANYANIPWDYTDGDTLFWDLGDISPLQNQQIIVRDSVTLDLLVNDNTNHEAFITMTNVTDCNNSDNYILYAQEIVGAIDPNDKKIELHGSSARNYTVKDEEVRYKIRFENIGTYYASRVIVVDTLDYRLDPTTIKNIISSHPYTLEINGNIITWIFNNIKLEAKRDNELKSQGFVSFAIQYISDPQIGELVANKAHIQFDFEDYIQTNTVSKYLLATHPSKAKGISFVNIVPNPSSNIVYVSVETSNITTETELVELLPFTKINIVDINGKTIQKQHIHNTVNQYELDVSELETGIYIIQVTDYKHITHYGKLIKKK